MKYFFCTFLIFCIMPFADAQGEQNASSFAKSGIKISNEPWGENLPTQKIKPTSANQNKTAKKTTVTIDKQGKMQTSIDGKVMSPNYQKNKQSFTQSNDQYQPFLSPTTSNVEPHGL